MRCARSVVLIASIALAACGDGERDDHAVAAEGGTDGGDGVDSSHDALSDASDVLLHEDWESFPVGLGWPDGSVHGAWRLVFAGFGEVGIEADGSQVLSARPQVSTESGETHASLVESVGVFDGDLELSARLKTVEQLREPAGSANPWETAWLAWGCDHADLATNHCYYFTLKTSGWEIGKFFGQPPGNQEFLATGSSPAVSLGQWHEVTVRQHVDGAVVSIDVWVDAVQIGSATDSALVSSWPVFTSGTISLYDEDAHAHFDEIWLRRPPP